MKGEVRGDPFSSLLSISQETEGRKKGGKGLKVSKEEKVLPIPAPLEHRHHKRGKKKKRRSKRVSKGGEGNTVTPAALLHCGSKKERPCP